MFFLCWHNGPLLRLGLLPQAFLNLQGFLCELLPAAGPVAFRRWAYTFSVVMAAASGRLPQLSGFYRILATAMQLAADTELLEPEVRAKC